MTKSDKKQPYGIGYGKPPKEHQFKPGTSGHPSGRPSREQTFPAKINRKLSEKRTIVVSGRQMQLTIEDILIETLVEKAAKKDSKLALFLVTEAQQYRKRQAKKREERSRPTYTQEDLRKMTEQERVDLYMRTMKELHGPLYKSVDSDED